MYTFDSDKLWQTEFILIKNVSSSTSHKKNSIFLNENFRKFFLTHSFMNRF